MTIEALQKQINEHRQVQNLNTKQVLDNIQLYLDNINVNNYIGKTEVLEAELFWHFTAIQNLSYIRI